MTVNTQHAYQLNISHVYANGVEHVVGHLDTHHTCFTCWRVVCLINSQSHEVFEVVTYPDCFGWDVQQVPIIVVRRVQSRTCRVSLNVGDSQSTWQHICRYPMWLRFHIRYQCRPKDITHNPWLHQGVRHFATNCGHNVAFHRTHTVTHDIVMWQTQMQHSTQHIHIHQVSRSALQNTSDITTANCHTTWHTHIHTRVLPESLTCLMLTFVYWHGQCP